LFLGNSDLLVFGGFVTRKSNIFCQLLTQVFAEPAEAWPNNFFPGQEQQGCQIFLGA
jgi:hypothetical protein